MSKEEKKYNVTILSRDTITVFPSLNEKKEVILVTYVAAGLPPRTIQIPKEEYTIEKEKELIRKDIESRLKAKPESYTV